MENAELKNIEELAQGHAAEKALDGPRALFEDCSGFEGHVFMWCNSPEYSTLDRIVDDDGVVDRLRELTYEESRRNL